MANDNTLPTLNARQLRALVEAASSLRTAEGDPYYLVNTPDQGLQIVPGQNGPPPDALAEFDTYDQQPLRPRVYDVTMTVGDVPANRRAVDLGAYDAVFWSEAAVEKFVFPYYASKSLWDAAYMLDRLANVWYGFVPNPATPNNTADVVEAIPFALAHLPSSEWVGKSESGDEPDPLGSALHLLFRKAEDGSVYPRPLSDFL